MSNVPPELRYARSHEWVRVDGDHATIGLTDHAQQELTDIVFAELPDVGRDLQAGESCAVVESVKTASELYAPVSGKVLETNPDVAADPSIVNTDPFGKGWFFTVRLTRPAEVDGLLDSDAYRRQIGG